MEVIAIVGYKPTEMNIYKADDPKIYYIKETIKKRLISFIERGLTWVVISGNMGVEMWAGEVIMHLKDTYDIKLGVIPPFQNQDQHWPEVYQNSYKNLISIADFHNPLYRSEYKGPFQYKARDKWLIEKTDGAILLYDEEHQGSPSYFLKEATNETEKNGYPLFFITPFDLEETVSEIEMNDATYWSQDFPG